MSAKEIAARFDMPVSTVYWLADAGQIPYVDARKPYHSRRRLLFDPAKVSAALEHRLLTGQPQGE